MTGPLADLLVVDLSRALAGPHAAMMLGDLGARVIKVETPGTGDDTRGWGPPFVGPADARESTYFLSANRNKQSIELDLKDPDDLETLRAMLRRADVLIENFRPGVLDRLGLDPAALQVLNPWLVVLAISGFGHDGPEGGRAGYDQIAQGEAGLMSLTGSGPDDVQRVGVPIGDLLAGMYGAYGVLAALHERATTGRGQVVRTSLLAAIVGVHAFQGTRYTVAGEVGRAQGNHHPSVAPYGLFATADGAIQLAVGSETLWRAFCPVIGLDPDTPDFATNSARVAHRAELIATIERAFADRASAALLVQLAAAGIPAGVVRSIDEVYAWPQTRSQGLVVEVEHPTLGTIELPGPPLRFFDFAGGEQTRREHAAPPTLGQHGAAVRAWLDEEAPDARA
ncbi:CaiB/BaiF CoA transferase family protein [Microcella sp.]|uniref:CaiB/BaiF CoA transferase family protein n=1 Tax=Microcella sp. TaxID=1913979 RepID=UPI003F7173FE